MLTESCKAERLAADTSASAELRLELGMAPNPDSVFYRLKAQATLKSEEGKDVGRVEVSVVTRYDITEGEVPDEDTLLEFADRDAAVVAYPYVREGIQSLAARIGFAGVLIPMLEPRSNLEDMSQSWSG
ncbi:hypothetical protein ACQEV4_39100 [Streptomyces shenzhenensis]|uniref:hypothetical protein n=1 Tax=Streptomyces shenzhenensis TaxID=943815 RepID=UPI003D912EFC